ncbi:uncharacterized protein LOC116345836 [Contarinia nasturtii]|uniref:uncharacterized protein LOC116345836 n=1 Tax=Contarinia nasturtii TaxID=265458 RepID=UPI0012D3DE81|nr:uncharacterized protein LOC116345836 [Contarinia nasturtii]
MYEFSYFKLVNRINMNLAVFLVFGCAVLTQVMAQPNPGNPTSGTSKTLELPKRNISVAHYRPRAQDFLTNLDSIPTATNSIRVIEPVICSRMRGNVNGNLKLVYDHIFRELKRFTGVVITSTSANVPDAINDAQTATDTAIKGLSDLAKKFLTEINEKCAKLTSVDTLSTINQSIEKFRATQLSNCIKLASIPDRFESVMQSYYKPVEDIVGTN